MAVAAMTFFYKRLGARYPLAFMAVELQTALVIVGGTLALFTFYFDGDTHEYLTVLAIALVLTEAAILASLWRITGQIRPIREWIAGDRDERSTHDAWSAAINLPVLLLKRDLPIPVLISVLPICIVSVAILDLPVLGIFPLLAGAAVAMGYSAILHYLAVEAGMRPVLLDINSNLSPRQRTDFWAVSLRTRLLVALPLINLITGLVVAALTSDGGGSSNLGLDVLVALAGRDDDLARAHGDALEVDPAPAARPLAGGRPGQRGRLRRQRPGDHRRRARRAGGELQRDGRRARRARAHPRGLRHLPRRGGRRVHPLRGLQRGGGRGRGHGDVLRRARLHRVRLRRDAAGGGRGAQPAVRGDRADHRRPRRPHRQVRGRRPARRLRRPGAVRRPRRPRGARRLRDRRRGQRRGRARASCGSGSGSTRGP